MRREILKVLTFQQCVNAPTPLKPTLLPKERAVLRISLQLEELNEMREAIAADDIVEIADAIVDQMYLLIGTSIEYGMGDRLQMMFNEVHSSNMTKMGSDGKAIFREDGKVIKSSAFTPPNLKAIIEKDFDKFSDLEESLVQISDNMIKKFDQKVEKHIKAKLEPQDLEKFKQMKALEKQLAKVIDIKPTEVMGLKIAEITLYGKDKFEIWE